MHFANGNMNESGKIPAFAGMTARSPWEAEGLDYTGNKKRLETIP